MATYYINGNQVEFERIKLLDAGCNEFEALYAERYENDAGETIYKIPKLWYSVHIDDDSDDSDGSFDFEIALRHAIRENAREIAIFVESNNDAYFVDSVDSGDFEEYLAGIESSKF